MTTGKETVTETVIEVGMDSTSSANDFLTADTVEGIRTKSTNTDIEDRTFTTSSMRNTTDEDRNDTTSTTTVAPTLTEDRSVRWVNVSVRYLMAYSVVRDKNSIL